MPVALTPSVPTPCQIPPKRLALDWTSDAAGNAQETFNLQGVITRVVTKPDGTAVPTEYDVTLSDEEGIDVCGGDGANRSATDAEEFFPVDSTTGVPRSVAGRVTFAVANAGPNKKGRAVVYYR